MRFGLAASIGPASLLLASACAGASEPVAKVSEGTVFEGQIFFWNEFNLYPYPKGSAREKECISGTFPIRRHVDAHKFDGRYVRVHGRMVTYDSLTEEVGLEKGWRGASIPKYCRGDQVILGDRIELLDRAGDNR